MSLYSNLQLFKSIKGYLITYHQITYCMYWMAYVRSLTKEAWFSKYFQKLTSLWFHFNNYTWINMIFKICDFIPEQERFSNKKNIDQVWKIHDRNGIDTCWSSLKVEQSRAMQRTLKGKTNNIQISWGAKKYNPMIILLNSPKLWQRQMSLDDKQKNKYIQIKWGQCCSKDNL